MQQDSLYLQNPVDIETLPDLHSRWLFAGIDMAPVDTLETGVALIDRDKKLMRMDKMDSDADLFRFLESLGPKSGVVIALDMPKSLSMRSKWHQQEVRMHPLRLDAKARTNVIDRFAPRARKFYDKAQENGWLILNFFTHPAKMEYGLTIPYKHRSPQGCKAMQALISEKLGIKEMPTNLAPSSVLDAMIAAYTSWSLVHGEAGKHFDLFADDQSRYYLDPIEVVPEVKKKRFRRHRRYSRR